MPQTSYLTTYAASYPILAKVQKPGGVTVLSAVSGGDVPNKHTYAAGTIQMASFEAEGPQAEEAAVTSVAAVSAEEEAPAEEEAVEEEAVEEEPVEEEPRHPRGRGRRR